MNQESSYMKQQSYNSYSSKYGPQARRYATLEESEAVLPVFSTPTNMYIRQYFSPPQPQQPQRNNYSNSYESQQAKNHSNAFTPKEKTKDESSTNNYRTHHSSNSNTKSDEIISQLVDMGFDFWKSKVAVDAAGGTNLQDALDILVQNEQAENSMPKPKSNHEDEHSSDDDLLKEESWRRQQEERKRDYLDQLNRNKPTPPIPDYSYKTDPFYIANKERKQGNFSFNKRQFYEAEKSYTLAINALPAGHGDLVLLLNNRAAAFIKQGKFNECLQDCTVAVDIARKLLNSPLPNIMQETSTTMNAQLLKAIHRKACALEGLHRYQEAIQTYGEYTKLDGSNSTQISQGIARCQQALLNNTKTTGPSWKPANDQQSAFPNIDISIFIPQNKPQMTQAEIEEINNSKAVQEMRDREKRREAEEAEKLMKEDQVNAKITNWKSGKERNLRALLGSLELILWPGVQWKGIMMAELLDVKKCKITYMKAIAKVHPDKLSANSTVEQRMLANGIFTTLNQAWDVFKVENNL